MFLCDTQNFYCNTEEEQQRQINDAHDRRKDNIWDYVTVKSYTHWREILPVGV